MLTNAVINPLQKKNIFLELQKIDQNEIERALISAALSNQIFPSLLEQNELSALKNAYSACKNNIDVKQCLEQAITAWFNSTGTKLFQSMLTGEFDESSWQTGFLVFMANTLAIQIQHEPVVELAINNGKILWRVMKNNVVLHDRTTRKDPTEAFDFSKAPCVLMTWEQFRIFKDSGKRGGTVAITPFRFFLHYKGPQKSTAYQNIWLKLKDQGVLDHNNRLSHIWRFAAGNIATTRFDYSAIATSLHNITEQSGYSERIDCIPGAKIYRSERSPKTWYGTGFIENADPESERHQVKLLDVSTYQDLNNHDVQKDGLDHDHIPSISTLDEYKYTLINSEQNKLFNIKQQLLALEFTANNTSGYSTRATTQPLYNELQIMKSNIETYLQNLRTEDKNKWWCIALPAPFHHDGLTYMKTAAAQKLVVTKPFFDEVSDYLNKLEIYGQNQTPNYTYLAALGAFRYLYRCQIKSAPMGVSSRFFNDNTERKQEIDQLFYDRLSKFMKKSEGIVTESPVDRDERNFHKV